MKSTRLTVAEVRNVAVLARLRLSAAEEERLTVELDSILGYVGQLNQLDTSAVEPFTHAVDASNPLREDKVTNQPAIEPLLSNAPERDDSFFKVPKIIE